MIPLIKHTFIHPITHSETVALAMRHWPMPCMIEIRMPTNEGIPSYANGTPPGHGALRTASGLGMIAESFDLKVGHLMCTTVTKENVIELLETISIIEDRGPVVGFDGLYWAMLKIAALRTIALPTPYPIELKGVAV